FSSFKSKVSPSKMKCKYSLLTENCKRIIDKEWGLICNGNYPEDVHIRFKGTLYGIGDPYTVFRTIGEDSKDLMIVIGSEELGYCQRLFVMGMNLFQCTGEDELVRIVQTNHSHVVCMDFFFRMAHELEMACHSGEVEENAFTVLYFANVEDKRSTKSGGFTIGFDMVLPLLSILLAILLFLRWR
ncbi:hypothetical protein KR084_000113, partial [Drosophila pseudotakahashii]